MLVTLESLINDNINTNDDVVDTESLEFDITDTIMECSELSMDINTLSSGITVMENVQMEGFGEKIKQTFKIICDKFLKFLDSIKKLFLKIFDRIVKNRSYTKEEVIKTVNTDDKKEIIHVSMSKFQFELLTSEIDIQELEELLIKFGKLDSSNKIKNIIDNIYNIIHDNKNDLIEYDKLRDENGRLPDKGLSLCDDIKQDLHNQIESLNDNCFMSGRYLDSIFDIIDTDYDRFEDYDIEKNDKLKNTIKQIVDVDTLLKNDIMTTNSLRDNISTIKNCESYVKNMLSKNVIEDIIHIDSGLTDCIMSSLSSLKKVINNEYRYYAVILNIQHELSKIIEKIMNEW